MTKKLLVVAASGLVLAILLLSAAWVVGGKPLTAVMHNGGLHFTWDDDDHGDHGAQATRSLAFDPAVPLTVDAMVNLHFVRGDHPSMTVSGPARLVDAVHWQDGRLSQDEVHIFGHHSLRVDIVAPRLPPFTFAGAGNVTLDKIDQDDLQLDLSGAGNIDANGRVNSITVKSSGAGSVDLGDLDAGDAKVNASGVGNMDINAHGKVNVSVSGVGNVTLHHKPAELTTQVSGVGSIDQDY